MERPEDALPSDAVCVHHPAKRAVALCEGSGDYICALCRVDVDGESFSAQFLERAGKGKLKKAFGRHLERPDRIIRTAVILLFIPGFNVLMLIAWPWLIFKYFRMMRQRREDPVYRRLVGMGNVWLCRVLLTLYPLFLVLVPLLIVAMS